MKDDYKDIFVAIPEAVISCGELAYYSTDSNRIYNASFSDPLGFFLVRPIRRFKIFHDSYGNTSLKKAVVGFAEINTGKKIIDRTFKSNASFGTEIFQHDIYADIVPSVGDIHWKLDETAPAFRFMHFHDIDEYRNLSKEEIYFRLNDVYTKATQLTSSRCKIYQRIK